MQRAQQYQHEEIDFQRNADKNNNIVRRDSQAFEKWQKSLVTSSNYISELVQRKENGKE